MVVGTITKATREKVKVWPRSCEHDDKRAIELLFGLI